MTTVHKQAPGPKGNALVGSLADARRDPIAFFLSCAETYGDIVRMRLGPATAFLLRSPDAFKQVFIDEQRNFSKNTNAYRNLRLVLGNGLVTSEGDFWLRQRRIAQPAFQREKIAAIANIVTEETERMLARWAESAEREEPLDILREMMGALAHITGRALLGTDVSSAAGDVDKALNTLLRIAQKRAMSVFSSPPSWPTSQNRQLRTARAVLDRFIYGIIEERRANGADGNDVLSMLIRARDEETGDGMSSEQLRDEVLTLYSAGFETTATGLAWALYLLSRNKGARKRLHAEVDRVLAGRTPTVADLPALAYTRRVIEETMRLRPPVWNIARRVVAPTTIGGYHVPARAFLFCCAYVAHRNPTIWERPEDFDPDRFLPERIASVPRLAYMPFGAGPRMCIGNNLAMLEETLVLAMIAQRFQLAIAGPQVHEDPMLVLRPRPGLKMIPHRRATRGSLHGSRARKAHTPVSRKSVEGSAGSVARVKKT